MMTRKDFEAIAEAIRFSGLSPDAQTIAAKAFIPVAKRSNPQFNAQRFLEAATMPGITPVPRKGPCIECGTVGVEGVWHYPGGEPEDGPRHRRRLA